MFNDLEPTRDWLTPPPFNPTRQAQIRSEIDDYIKTHGVTSVPIETTYDDWRASLEAQTET